ncbi:MAG: ECF transporter S component [Tissierellia bacterium]|nr:ECF transporter S component [Tissierellia bacterium]
MNVMRREKDLSVKKMVIVAMLGAITVVLGLTPLGFVPIGPLNATTMHIPVLIGAILEGPVVGGLVGLIFGLSSLFNAITRPTPISFVFYNPLISIVPRILLGVLSGLLFEALRKREDKNIKTIVNILWGIIILFLGIGLYRGVTGGKSGYMISLNIVFLLLSLGTAYMMNRKLQSNLAVMVSAFAGTLLHSLMVMGGIYFFFAERYLQAFDPPISMEAARTTIFGVILTSGVPEGILAVIIVSAVVAAMKGKYPKLGR